MFRSLFKMFRPGQVGKPIRRRPSCRPIIEYLEDRCVPAILAVNSAADNTIADNSVTLREALQIVNGTLGRALTAGEQSQISGTLGTNDTVQFSLPSGVGTITLTGGALSITKPVTVNGPGADNLTVSANHAGRVFVIGTIYSRNLSLTASIRGLTIADGSALTGSTNYGAGLLNFGTLKVTSCNFTGNAAGSSGGGAIFNVGTLAVSDSLFSGNSVTNSGAGAGILNLSSSTLTVTGCTFTGNSGTNGSSGGGVSNSGTATVTNSTFANNTVASNGAGIHNSSSGNLTVRNSTFSNGVASSDGGGIDNDGVMTITTCLFNSNSAGSEGGAIDNHGTLTAIRNSTLVGNSALSRGGAIHDSGTLTMVNCTVVGNRVLASSGVGGGLNNPSPATIHNSIIAANYRGAAPSTTANDIAGNVLAASSFNLIGLGGAGGLTNGANGNQVGVSDPGLASLADNGGPTQSMMLLPSSPAIDHGTISVVNTNDTDQRGKNRFVNGAVDIGATEVQVVAVPPSNQSAVAQTVAAVNLGSFSDANLSAGLWTITVNWGDGSNTETFTTSTPGSLGTRLHTYATAGVATVTVLVADPFHDASQMSFLVNVSGIPSNVATQLAVDGFPSPITAGVSGNFTIRATDSFGNVIPSFTGTVHFTSTDPLAALPADYTFTLADGGVHTFSATFNTPGIQSLSVASTAGITIIGMQTGITVNSGNTNYFVNSTADNTTADTLLTLREALGVVNGTLGRALTPQEQSQITGTPGNHDTIRFSLPTSANQINLTAGRLDITNPVSIVGPGADSLTIFGNNSDRVFIVGHDYSRDVSLVASISGLTISGGSAIAPGSNYGGGLLNFGTLTLSNVTFSGNTAGSSGGGAIYNVGVVNADHCIFTSNSAVNGGPGGAIQNATPATFSLTNSTVSGNSANNGGSGGGIANSGQLTVAASSVTSNIANSNGGGIYNSQEGNFTMSTTTVANNSAASDGGGLDNDGAGSISASTIAFNSAASEGGGIDADGSSTLTVLNSTIYGNTAVSRGGGIFITADALFTNCTITANRVTNGSSGLFGGGIFNSGVPAKLFNTIVAGNFRGPAPGTTADDIIGSVDLASAFNLIGAGGSGGLLQGSNNNQVGIVNLGLGVLADNGGPTMTVALLPGSAAIDQGGDSYVAVGETDQRGLTRIVNGRVDIGAFEIQ